MLRVEGGVFGVPRPLVVEALRAEGIPCSAGYGFPLPEQPMFRHLAFGPYLPDAAGRLDYAKAPCPNADRLCREQALWLEQAMFLGKRADMDDIAAAFEKIFDHREALAAEGRRRARRAGAGEPR